MHAQTHAWQDVIKRSDKARLYQYRITDECYHGLQAHLIAHHKQLKDVHKARQHGLDKAFVLYAAEWWRREYDGDWGWQQLLASIGLDANDINNQDRVTLTETGLRKWGLAIRKTYNEQGHVRRNALGSFLVEGGLPIHFINASQSANNWLMLLLDRALDALALDQDPWVVIQDYQMRLPKSARHDDVLRLLTTLAKDIHQLVDQFGLDQHIDTDTDPLAYLNQRNPDWADSLALHLGNQAASELLKKLLIKSSQTVKRLKTQSSKHQSTDSGSASDFFSEIALVRHLSLIRTHDGSYDISLHGSIANPRIIKLDKAHSEALEAENYYLKFGNQQDDDVGYWSARHSYSQNQLKLDGSRPIALAESTWTDAISLSITDGANTNIPSLADLVQLPSMMAVPTDAPFLAQIENDDDGYEARYIGSYSQACRDDEVLVYIPSALEHTKTQSHSTRLEKLASLQVSGFDGSLYLLAGEISLGDGNARYRLRSGIKDARHQYTLIGRQHPDFCYPAQVFLGDFYIQRHNLDDDQAISQIISKKDIYIRGKRSMPYRKLSDIDSSKLFGGYHVIVKNTHNEVVFGAHIGIVPTDFSYKSKPNTTDGVLYFRQAHITDISCDNADIAISRAFEPNSFRLIASHQIPKGKLTLSLIPPSAGVLKFQCYFPSNAVYICDANGSTVSANTHFCLDDDLDGYRLNIISTSPLTDPTLYFQLESNKNYRQSLSLATHDRHYLQIPLYGFVDYAKSLLHQSPKGLDETVQVLLGHSVQPLCSFSYYHYQLDLDKTNHRLYLVPNKRQFQYVYREPEQELLMLGNAVSLTAVNFCNPTDCRTLTRCDNLFWDLTELHDSQDVWFIYPHHEGTQKIRPIAYTPFPYSNQASTTIEPLGALGLATKLSNTQERKGYIAQTLKDMAYDFDHDGWQYIKAMAQACPEVTLISFDHFKVARDYPEFLVAAQCVFDHKPLAKEILDQVHPIWSLLAIDEFDAVLQTYQAYRSSHQSHATSLMNNLDDGNQQSPCQILKLPKWLKTQPICQLMFEILTKPDNTPLNIKIIGHMVQEVFESHYINAINAKKSVYAHHEFVQIINTIYQTIPNGLRPSPKNWNETIWQDYSLVYYTPIVLAWLSNHPNDALRHELLALPSLHLDISTIQNSAPQFFSLCYEYCLRWFYHHRI